MWLSTLYRAANEGLKNPPEIEVAVVMMAFFLYGMSHYANLIRLQIHVGCSKMGGQIRNVLTGCNRETTIQVSFSH